VSHQVINVNTEASSQRVREIPTLLTPAGRHLPRVEEVHEGSVDQPLKARRSIAQAEGHTLHLKESDVRANGGLMPVLFTDGNVPKTRKQVHLREKGTPSQLVQTSRDIGQSVPVWLRYRIERSVVVDYPGRHGLPVLRLLLYQEGGRAPTTTPGYRFHDVQFDHLLDLLLENPELVRRPDERGSVDRRSVTSIDFELNPLRLTSKGPQRGPGQEEGMCVASNQSLKLLLSLPR
jgi:hypothetical protein